MAEQLLASTVPHQKHRWVRRLVWLFGGLILLLAAAYFTATSGAFLKGFILPRVAKAINAEITASDASISPFHQVVLKDLKVKTTGSDPLVVVPEVRLRYSLLDIIGGNINVEEVAVVSPTVIVVVNADGTSNLDPFTKSGSKEPVPTAKPAVPAKPGKPLQLNLKKVALTGATVRYITIHANGSRDAYEVSNVNFTLSDLKNGQTGKVALAAAIQARMNPPAPGLSASMQATLSLNLDLGLAADAKLATAKGNLHLGVDKADGGWAQLATFSTDLDCDLTPTDLKGLVLRFQKGAAALGQIRASGPLDLAKLEGRIVFEIPALDKQVLNLAAADRGMDFGTTVIKSTNTIVLAQAGSVITAGGQLSINRLQVTITNQTTPALDFLVNYDVSVDRAKDNTVLRAFNLSAMQDGASILHSEITSPITLSLGDPANVLGDSTVTLGVTSLDLAKWKPILGTILPAGMINAQLKALVQQGGKRISLDIASSADQLTLAPSGQPQANASARETATSLSAKLAANFAIDLTAGPKLPIVKGNAHLGINRAEGSLSALTLFSTDLTCDITPTRLNTIALQFAKGGTPLGEVRASGPFDLAKMEGRIVVEIPSIDHQLLNLATAGKGMDFGTTVIRSTNTVELSNSGMLIKAGGHFSINGLQITLTNQTTPSLDFSASYELSVDRAQSNAVLRALSLSGVQQGSPILHADLNNPMSVAWSRTAPTVGDSTLSFAVTGLNLANWRPLLGTVAPSGVINAQLKLFSQQAGKQLTLELSSTVDGLTVLAGTNSVAQAGVSLQLNGKSSEFKQFSLGQYKLQVSQRNQPLLSASGSASFDKESQDTSLKLTVQLMVGRVLQALSMPMSSAISNALSQVDLTADVAVHKQVTNLRQIQISLAPTSRATNQVSLTGQVDMTQTNALQGNLKLTAEALDFTAYYDLFAGGRKPEVTKPVAATKPSGTASQPSAPTSPPQEPAPVKLPIGSFTIDTSIRRLYLHDVEVADFQTGTRLDSNHVAVAPFRLTLNGAPVSAGMALDLSVPGYRYDFDLTATNLPIPPLISSFQPERKGQISGTLTAQAGISGTGITGPSLQTNLAGQFYFGTTNLNLSVENVQNKLLKALVTVIVQVPDLIKNPASAASGLLSRLTGSTNNPTPSDLQHSVINSIVMRGGVASGKLTLQQASISGPTFLAEAPTTVTLDPVLTNSALNVPVSISLSRAVAQKIRFMPANTPTNATYVKLPDFFTMKGTLGAPQKDLNTMALLSGTAQGIAPALGGKAGSIIQGVTGLLGGGNTNSATGSNASSGGLLQGLGGFLNKPATNPPSTQTNAAPANNLLDSLFGPKKK